MDKYRVLAALIREGAVSNTMSLDQAVELIREQFEQDNKLLQDKIDTLEQMVEDERDMAMNEDA